MDLAIPPPYRSTTTPCHPSPCHSPNLPSLSLPSLNLPSLTCWGNEKSTTPIARCFLSEGLARREVRQTVFHGGSEIRRLPPFAFPGSERPSVFRRRPLWWLVAVGADGWWLISGDLQWSNYTLHGRCPSAWRCRWLRWASVRMPEYC